MSRSRKNEFKSQLALSRVNDNIDVATGTERISFAGQPIVIQRDTVLMPGREFSAGEHQLQLLDYQRKGLIQVLHVIVAKSTVESGPVSEKMQAVALLHQTSSKTGCDRTL